MRIAGKTIQGPNVETVVIPREEGDIVFKCKAVLDYSDFEKLLKEPTPPYKTVGTKKPFPDFEDVGYLKEKEDFGYKKFLFMVITSLTATPGLEFDNVNPVDPTTWGKLEQELKDSGLSPAEVGTIFQGVTSANGMNEEKMKEARARFFEQEKLKGS